VCALNQPLIEPAAYFGSRPSDPYESLSSKSYLEPSLNLQRAASALTVMAMATTVTGRPARPRET